ncbi:MFS transporter [Pseudonocardia sp. N23]|uniref:MFS transporter n=1 Tax=Pseudonocardia sp. N23 TaxID=1987376 RepID=UPI000C034B14|nr:MFS transporter [Pseudonocardia sp. N23]GAY10695.1 major facilitator superfamily MFS_1 [Pseudonocardia sp. N23]
MDARPVVPRRARLAVALTFAANGSVFGSWAPRVPEIKAALGLSDGTLGLALLAPGAGSLLTLPLAGGIAARWGSGRTTRWALVAFFLSALPIAWAAAAGEGAAPLFGALLLFGATTGALDVLMNAQGITVEQSYRRSVLSSFHAVFSLGALGGTLVGSVAAAHQVPLLWQFVVLGMFWLVVVLPVSAGFLPDPPVPDDEPRPPVFAVPRGPLIPLAIAAFAVLLAEGATADWSAVLLRDSFGAGAAAAGAAFAAFSATMTLGRLVGDRVLTRLGRRRAVRLFAGFGAGGLTAGLIVAELTDGPVAIVAVVAGFMLLGAGISITFPALLAEAGVTGARAAPALAAVSSGGYSGFLVGPTVIGGLAELTSLRVAIWFVALTAVLPVVLVRARAVRAG